MDSWQQQADNEARRYHEEQGADGLTWAERERIYGRAPAVDRRVEKAMGLMAKDTGGGGDFKRVPAGTHIGRCYRIIDLGTQESTYNGDKKLQHKIQVYWETFGEDEQGGELITDDGMPLVISRRYTLSLGDKATLRKDLEAWRGKAFTADELKGFDLTALLGKFCMVSVIHNAEGDKTYANVNGLASVPKVLRDQLPAGVHEIQMFDLSEPDWGVFDSFHEKLQETIKSSMEWKQQHASPKAAKAEPATAGGGFDDCDDDIPF